MVNLYGQHPLRITALNLARRVSQLPCARVLLTGESGTGKTLLARHIHGLSGATRLVEIRCASTSARRLEAELPLGDQGFSTVILDDIAALPLELQAALVAFLDACDANVEAGQGVRVVGVSSQDVRARVRDHAFRADLLYRLDVASIRLPALREMPEAISAFATFFAHDLSRQHDRPVPRLTARSFDALSAYSWPGNLRELSNAVERALLSCEDAELRVDLPLDEAVAPTSSITLEVGLPLEEVERRYITAALRGSRHGDVGRIARMLGISRKTLWEKRRRYGLDIRS